MHWKEARQHVQVFKFSTEFFRAVPPDVLGVIINYLNQRHIALGLEMEIPRQRPEANACQPSGDYANTALVTEIISKIKAAGGTFGYIAALGPFYSIQDDSACIKTVADAAKNIAPLIALYHAAFPDALMGEIEPFPITSLRHGWKAEFAHWGAAFRGEAGLPFDFIVLDIDWQNPLKTHPGERNTADPEAVTALVRKVAAVARRAGFKIGVIYNGRANAR